MPLPELVAAIRTGDELPERRFVLTFDDGYRSVFHAAFPVVRELGFTASVFVVTGEPDASRSAPDPLPGGREMLRFAELRELVAAGWHLGAHGVSHADLTVIRDDAAVVREVTCSRDILEERTQAEVLGFSYPFGRVDDRVRRLVSEHVPFAVTDRLAQANARSDPYLLPRVETFYFRTLSLYGLLRSGSLSLALHAISGPRNLRRWSATRTSSRPWVTSDR